MDWKFFRGIINYPYAIISDVHLHSWSQFSSIGADGVNSRLQDILNAIEEACTRLESMGGNDLIITGDLFHTRGIIKPSVLNPTIALFKKLTSKGFRIHAIPGNHDLEGKNSDKLGNALIALSNIPDFYVHSEPTYYECKYSSTDYQNFYFIPWFEDSKKVLEYIKSIKSKNATVFCHVGLSGVIKSHIGNTINSGEILKEGLKYVFCGHFHNHVGFDSRVYSVGALTHQTWSDVGSLAGYIIVDQDKVEQYESKAPIFIDYGDDDIYTVRDKFLRIKDVTLTEEELKKIKDFHKSNGGKGLLDLSVRPEVIREDKVYEVKTTGKVEDVITEYCKARYPEDYEKILAKIEKIKNERT